MKYCLSVHCKSASQADEIRVPFNKIGDAFPKYANKRLVVDVSSAYDLSKLKQQIDLVKQGETDYTLACGSINQLDILLNAGYNAYLDLPVTTWEDFQVLNKRKVSDIWVSGQLCFQARELRRARCGIKFRFSPTNDPVLPGGRTPRSFFVLPQDLSVYSSALDVVDFREPNADREDTLFRVYTRQSKPYLQLADLLPGLPAVSIDALQDFGQARANCHQECMVPGSRCRCCDSAIDLAANMDNFIKK